MIVAHPHLREDRWKRDEYQARTRIRRNTEREARREDDEARCERNEGIEPRDTHRFARERVLLVDVAAEDLHRSKADRKREECLTERREHRIRKCTRTCEDLREIGVEVERDARARPFQSDRADHEHRNKGE